MWLQSQHHPRCIWDVPLTHHPVSPNTKGHSWPHFGSSWTQLPFKGSQITCPISLSKMIPEITIESADWGLRIPDFFDNWYLFPHLSLLAFLLISRFPQNSWQQSDGYHRKFSAYPETCARGPQSLQSAGWAPCSHMTSSTVADISFSWMMSIPPSPVWRSPSLPLIEMTIRHTVPFSLWSGPWHHPPQVTESWASPKKSSPLLEPILIPSWPRR